MLIPGASRGMALAAAAFLTLAVVPGLDSASAKPAAASSARKASATSGAKKSGARSGTTTGKGGKAKVTQARGNFRGGKGKASRWTRRGPANVVASKPPVATPAPVVAAPVPVAQIPAQAFVPVVVGGITSTSARIASDLATVLDSDSLRVLPVMTRSSLPDVLALAQADKADAAFLHADLLATLPQTQRSSFTSRIAYVARLYNEEVHVIAGRDINSIRDLAGKKVNVGLKGSANAQTAELIFDRLGIVPIVVYNDQPTALAQLATGDIAADVLVSGRPVRALQDFAGDGHFKLLAVPYDAALQDIYLPAKIEAVDYGNLVPPGRAVETLAVPIVLATFDATPGSPRAARMTRFTDALFARMDTLRDAARHPKWRDVNLAANVAGWPRFAAAQAAIDRSVSAPGVSGMNPVDPARQMLSADDPRLLSEFRRQDKTR